MKLKADLIKLAIVAIFIAGLDVIQSWYLQTQIVNPYSEANLLPLDFFKLGFLGYLAYWPIDALFNFVLLAVFWIAAVEILRFAKQIRQSRTRPKVVKPYAPWNPEDE